LFERIVVNSKESANLAPAESLLSPYATDRFAAASIPDYLQKTYWWAYLHPNAVRVFERQWLVNLILWGNFARLRNAALDELGTVINERVLQVACVYGNFTEHLVSRLGPDGHLNVIDVAPIQITNLHAKLKPSRQVTVQRQDSTDLQFEDASLDTTVVFFLLHEQPLEVRLKTLAEAWRVTRPGGKIVFVDYHRPVWANPFRYLMVPILTTLEPFAMDLWRTPITDWLPSGVQPAQVDKTTYFGGLYQKVVLQR
jgi:ubiquinone/menaquinone biosynthesis C-methylase UbiE